MLKRANELERDRPKTIEGHVAVFHNLSDPGFVKEFRERIIKFANDYSGNDKYKQS